MTPLRCAHSISPESSDGFASVGTILPKERSRPVAGRLLSFSARLLRVHTKAQSRPELLLLISLLLVILLYPVLDHGELQRLLLGGLTLLPVVFSTIRLSQVRIWMWPSVLLMSGAMILVVVTGFQPNPALLAIKWALLTAFFGVAVLGLFSYLRNARSVLRAHLYTAASIYLLLGMLWFTIYCAIDSVYPGSFVRGNNPLIDRQSDLLYFSLVTLSTVGYGDVVPLYGEVRILAALEGITGVLYIGFSVAILVSAFRLQSSSAE